MDLEKPRRRRGQQLEDAILDAAWELLRDDGYARFTVEAVAERAGTSRPVIYRRWPDRDALVGAAIAHELGRSRIAVPDTGSLRGDVIELMHRFGARRANVIPMLSVLVSGYMGATGTSFADLRVQAFGPRSGHSMDVILDRAIARGEVDPARLTPRVRTVALDLIRHDMLMTLKPPSDDAIAQIVDEVLLPLVRPATVDGPT